MIKIIRFSIVTILLSQSVFAQETIYFSKDATKNTTTKKKGSTQTNIIKISPLAFLGGILPAYYERKINETFSVEFGAGITATNYVKDAMRAGVGETNPDVTTTTWSNGKTDTYSNENDQTKNKKSTLGYFVTIQPRAYITSEGLEGSFFGISYSLAKFNSTSKKIVTGTPTSSDGTPTFTSNTYNANETITDLLVNYGSQVLYDHISVEYSGGIGLRKITGSEYAYAKDGSFSGTNYVDGSSTINKSKIGFNISIKIGYHF